ncbi:UNVERIFIED_CONTAM: hypothetical protein FKN15_063858 [Acipenser sinensis]
MEEMLEVGLPRAVKCEQVLNRVQFSSSIRLRECAVPLGLKGLEPGSLCPQDSLTLSLTPGSLCPQDSLTLSLTPGSLCPQDSLTLSLTPGSLCPQDSLTLSLTPGSLCPQDSLTLSLTPGSMCPQDSHSLTHSRQPVYLQFTLRLGSRSILSTCRAPDQPGEGVLLHYSFDNGITWKLLQHFTYQGFHEPRIISVELPEDGQRFGVQFRWWQPYHSGRGLDVWAIDEITMTSVLFNSISLNFNNLLEVTQSLGFYLGNVQPYCGHDWTLRSSATRFRWIQSYYTDQDEWALDSIYIGQQCSHMCHGHGWCNHGLCRYLPIAVIGTCVANVPNPSEMNDQFEGKLSPLWHQLTGGQVGSGCGTLSDGKALYFNSSGRREARTVPLDTTNTRLIQFYIRIGSNNLGAPCNKPRVRNEGVVVQYSGNNGVTWHLLRELDFISFLEPQIITIELTPEAKTPNTAFRWWQPLHGKHSAQWGLDDVLIGMNDSSRMGFQDKFDGSSDLRVNWYRVQGGQVEVDCLSLDTALLFNSDSGKPRYAESWDFHVSSSSFLQFEMSMGCSKPFPDAHAVQLQYSLNTGRDWHLLTPECVPPAIGCATYTQSSVYTSQRFQNWRRVTVYLPSATNSLRTRFRWIQSEYTPGLDSWSIDNALLASGCPWMCSGHGICDSGRCVCDRGFGGPYCVPITPLPSILKDDFNGNLHPDLWPEVYGEERGMLNGETLKSGTAQDLIISDDFDGNLHPDLWPEVYGEERGMLNGETLKSGMALIFKGEGLRMLVSRDLDCTHTMYIQFSFKFISKEAPERSHSILLQSSVNGGISWQLLDEFYFPLTTDVLFLHVPFPHAAQTNATRFRLWQPYNSGKKEEVWVIDDLIIDGNTMKTPAFLTDSFELGPREDSWLFYPGGNTGLYCPYLKGALEDDSAMVFVSSEAGEHSITTRDMDVSENTVIQFEFSRDFGATWHLLVPLCHGGSRLSSLCSTEHHPGSIYYPGTTQGWRRELVHFGKLRLCGSVRFRWYQGFYAGGTPPATWALDNVYIGPQCEDMCSGHGACVNGTHCECDPGYSGPTCKTSSTANPDFLTEDFEGSLDTGLFVLVSGGKPSRKCSILSSGNNLFFSEEGFRMLCSVSDLLVLYNREDDSAMVFVSSEAGEHSITTRDMDVSENTVIQFEFSRDFGATWHLLVPLCHGGSRLSSLCSTEHHPGSIYYPGTTQGWRRELVHFGKLRLCGSVRFRWYQGFYAGGTPPATWALDNVYIGPQCEDMCSGHGACVNGTHCECDPGYSGPTCKTSSTANPDFLTEDFEGNIAIVVGGSASGLPVLQDDFSLADQRSWLLHPGGTRMPVCGSSGDAFAFIEKANTRYAVTTDLTLTQDSFIQFDFSASCSISNSCYAIELEYSLDLGLTWQPLLRDCLPISLDCTRYQLQRVLVSDTFNKWGRVTLPIPPYARMEVQCLRRCSLSVTPLSLCALRQGCSRQLVTVDMNLTSAEFIQFYFMYGCLIPPSQRNQGVLLEFSVNGGITWTLLTEIFYDQYNKPGFLNVLLPPAARDEGVRVRWWQPKHDGLDQNDWALDNVLIGGSATQRTGIVDTFRGAALPQHERAPADSAPTGRILQEPRAEEST